MEYERHNFVFNYKIGFEIIRSFRFSSRIIGVETYKININIISPWKYLKNTAATIQYSTVTYFLSPFSFYAYNKLIIYIFNVYCLKYLF